MVLLEFGVWLSVGESWLMMALGFGILGKTTVEKKCGGLEDTWVLGTGFFWGWTGFGFMEVFFRLIRVQILG